MHLTVCADFHLHSDRSDGYLAPARLAELVAASGVSHAALTDHNSLDGLAAFHEAFTDHGGVAISGVEVFTRFDGREVHVLGYGFDPTHPALVALLSATAPTEEAISAIHQAQGLAFLAHPLHVWRGIDELDRALRRLKAAGLDGVEALYKAHSPEERKRLLELADRHDLLVSAGSDYHGCFPDEQTTPGVEVDATRWKAFRNALPAFRNERPGGLHPTGDPPRAARPNWRWLVLRIVLPAVLAAGLFVAAIFGIVLPTFEENLLARKREMIRELTNSAWSILDEYEKEVAAGRLTRPQAQAMAAERIKFMRYGQESKDYFWITDLHPRMIMHPYREELNGKDLSDFTDPQGGRPFVEFVQVVRDRRHGYVDYVWQWKDDPRRLEPKESYVRGFEPWGWIIGTGIYTEDVRREIAAMERWVVDLSAVIVFIVGLLLLYIILQSARIERRRSQAAYELSESHEKYRALVEATTEGTLLILGHRCAYANQAMLEMIGHAQGELPLLDIHDLFPPDGDEPNPAAQRIDAILEGHRTAGQFEGRLQHRDGSSSDVLLSVTRIEVAGKQGLVVVARDLSLHRAVEARLGEGLGQYRALANAISHGVFRAVAGPPWTLVEANPAACLLLGLSQDEGAAATDLDGLFVDEDERDSFFGRLDAQGSVHDMVCRLRPDGGDELTAAITAWVVRGPDGRARFCDGLLHDVSSGRQPEPLPDEQLSQLQGALTLLNESIRNNMQPVAACPANTPIDQAAGLLADSRRTVLVVTAHGGDVAGIVTQQDLAVRVVAEGHPSSKPIEEIMTSPVPTVVDRALAYEALLAMRQHHTQCVVVTDSRGHPVGLVRGEQLSRFSYYSPALLSREYRRAAVVSEGTQARSRLPQAVKGLLDLGSSPRRVARVVAAVCDGMIARFVTLAMQDLGPPPVPFAFVAFGSVGREEQTLVTDQDNALIYEDPTEESAEQVGAYFRQLGRRICEDLCSAGYEYCKGEVMAMNPRWNQPLSAWKECFGRWIREPNSQELMQFNICFDFRCVYGDTHLVAELRSHIQQVLKSEAPFFFHLARNCLQYNVPLGLFGKIIAAAAGQEARAINVKDAMMPIVSFARLYALQQGVEATNTADRIQSLADVQALHKDTAQNLLKAYGFLLRLRLRHQVEAMGEGRVPDNAVDVRTLSESEVAQLKEALSEVAMVQKKIGFDYPGAA